MTCFRWFDWSGSSSGTSSGDTG